MESLRIKHIMYLSYSFGVTRAGKAKPSQAKPSQAKHCLALPPGILMSYSK
jgi:hypothetical protein